MRHRRRPTFAAPAEAPIATVNTTPLIDVMLVLLIMFILTVPVSTHKVRMDLPTSPRTMPDPVIHELALDASGSVSWDGARLDEVELPARLAAMRAGEPEAVLRLRADGATRYEVFDRVLATVKRSGIERLGFVGNDVFRAAIG